jgi:hypothetical protein
MTDTKRLDKAVDAALRWGRDDEAKGTAILEQNAILNPALRDEPMSEELARGVLDNLVEDLQARGWGEEDAYIVFQAMPKVLWPDVPDWVLEKTLTVNMVGKLKSALALLPANGQL